MWPGIQSQLVLDVGCGPGLYTRELARRGAIAVGVDLNSEWLHKARKGQGKVFLVRADARYLPFRSGAFSMVVSIEVLSHISPEDRRRVLADICRVMASGGRVFCTMHNRRRLTLSRWLRLQRGQRVYQTNNLHVWPAGPEEGKAMVESSGLAVEQRCKYLNYHSRFSYDFFVNAPLRSRLIVAVEELFSRLPLLRCLAITFLLVAEKEDVLV